MPRKQPKLVVAFHLMVAGAPARQARNIEILGARLFGLLLSVTHLVG
jgi:hypothetical protein